MLAVSFPFHLGAVVNPIRRALHVDAALAGLHHLGIAPQVAAVRFGDEVGPPVVGGYGLVVALVDVEGTALHPVALVALVVAPLHGVAGAAAIGQRRIGGVAAPPHRHQLLGLNEKGVYQN